MYNFFHYERIEKKLRNKQHLYGRVIFAKYVHVTKKVF